MYKVMIVDDETIILSGIKFLLDWEQYGCVIAATARNGQDALDQIRKSPPDIILADINMPVMGGIELLKQVNEEFPYIVFIMLTNLEEFELARQALVCHAVDYLLKSRLEAPVLAKALEEAKKERDRRSRLMEVSSQHFFEQRERNELINHALQEMIFMNEAEAVTSIELLENYRMLDRYAFLHILFNYTTMPDSEHMTRQRRKEVLEWMRELTEKTAAIVFGQNYVFVETEQSDVLVLFLFHLEEGLERKLQIFQKKLSSNIQMIAQAGCDVINTKDFSGRAEMKDCRRAYQKAIDCYYLETQPEELPDDRFEALGLNGIGSALSEEIRRKNLFAARNILDQAVSRIKLVPHQKSQAIWLLNELNRSVSEALAELEPGRAFSEQKISSPVEIECIRTRSQVIAWMERLKEMMCQVLDTSSGQNNQLAERARKYVLEHLEEHISLQDAAAYVGVSQGYLSTVFKREYRQSFIDFSNQAKIEYACRLLDDNQLMVTEIAYQLGFENAYYFSKVFRKYKGMTPTEYQKREKF